MHSLKGAFTKGNDLNGLKSHDWHKFLQFILPIAITGCLTENIRTVIYKIATLVRWISQKEIASDTVELMKTNAIEAVTMMEKYLPSDVLTIQVHLLLHVVDEVAVCRDGTFTMDVLFGALHENFEGVCSSTSSPRRKYGNGMASARVSRVHH